MADMQISSRPEHLGAPQAASVGQGGHAPALQDKEAQKGKASARLTTDQKRLAQQRAAEKWRANAPLYYNAQTRAAQIIREAGGDTKNLAHVTAYMDAINADKAPSGTEHESAQAATTLVDQLRPQFAKTATPQSTAPAPATTNAPANAQAKSTAQPASKNTASVNTDNSFPKPDYEPPVFPLRNESNQILGFNEAVYLRSSRAQYALSEAKANNRPLPKDVQNNFIYYKELAAKARTEIGTPKSWANFNIEQLLHVADVVKARDELSVKWGVLPTHPAFMADISTAGATGQKESQPQPTATSAKTATPTNDAQPAASVGKGNPSYNPHYEGPTFPRINQSPAFPSGDSSYQLGLYIEALSRMTNITKNDLLASGAAARPLPKEVQDNLQYFKELASKARIDLGGLEKNQNLNPEQRQKVIDVLNAREELMGKWRVPHWHPALAADKPASETTNNGSAAAQTIEGYLRSATQTALAGGDATDKLNLIALMTQFINTLKNSDTSLPDLLANSERIKKQGKFRTMADLNSTFDLESFAAGLNKAASGASKTSNKASKNGPSNSGKPGEADVPTAAMREEIRAARLKKFEELGLA